MPRLLLAVLGVMAAGREARHGVETVAGIAGSSQTRLLPKKRKDPVMNRHGIIASACVAAAVLTAAGCHSSDHGAGARAAASSLAADPVYQAQVKKLQGELLANFQKDFHPKHPFASAKKAVEDTFPGGSSSKITNYAVHTFSVKDAHKGAAQTAWMHAVVTYALAQGAQGTGTGQPSIPGVTSTASSS